jgi:hypothetical protein
MGARRKAAAVRAEGHAVYVIRVPLNMEELLAARGVPHPCSSIPRGGGDSAPVGTEDHAKNMSCMSTEGEKFLITASLPEMPLKAAIIYAASVLRPLSVEEYQQSI